MQAPHPTHLSGSIRAVPPSSRTADSGQADEHLPHPVHLSSTTRGWEALCWSALPMGGAQPIPRFLMAPPKPAMPWPLKWETTIIESAAAISPAILAFWTSLFPISTST